MERFCSTPVLRRAPDEARKVLLHSCCAPMLGRSHGSHGWPSGIDYLHQSLLLQSETFIRSGNTISR